VQASPTAPADHCGEYCHSTSSSSGSSSDNSSDNSSEHSASNIQCAAGGALCTATESASRADLTTSSSNGTSRELVLHQQAHVRSSRSSSSDDSELVHYNSYTSGESLPLWGDSYRSLMFGSESDSGSGSEGSGSKHHAISESHSSHSDSDHSSSTSHSYKGVLTEAQCKQQAVQLSLQQQQQVSPHGISSGACVADSALQSGESLLMHTGASLHSGSFSSESAEAEPFTDEHRSACSSAVSYTDSSSSSNSSACLMKILKAVLVAV
jgi:hypothetical protein